MFQRVWGIFTINLQMIVSLLFFEKKHVCLTIHFMYFMYIYVFLYIFVLVSFIYVFICPPVLRVCLFEYKHLFGNRDFIRESEESYRFFRFSLSSISEVKMQARNATTLFLYPVCILND